MISPGAIVRIYRTGDTAWVVRGRTLSGRWKCISKAVDFRGRAGAFTSFTAGEGDMVLIKDPPTYTAGMVVERDGMEHTVLADDGEFVTLLVPASSFPLKRGSVRYEAGNTTMISKE